MRELKITEIVTIDFLKEKTTSGLTNRVELADLLKLFGAFRIEANGIVIRVENIEQNCFSSTYQAKASLEITLDCSE